MSPEGYLELQKYAEELGIVFFSTAFDIPSADYLEPSTCLLTRYASGDLRSIPLLKHVASFGKPMIVSTVVGRWRDAPTSLRSDFAH
jgi:N-acetylneuraminate synthase/sialic acid synthase